MQPGPKIALPDEFIVRKPFKMATKEGVYARKRGETFRWKESGIPERRIRQLWDQRYLATDVETEVDKARFEARRAAESAAIKSASKEPEPVAPEPVTAEDYGL